MKVRIISTLVLFPFFGYIIVKGGSLLAAMVLIISVIGLFEFFNLFEKNVSDVMTYCAYGVTFATFIMTYLIRNNTVFMICSFALIFSGSILFVMRKIKTNDLAISLLGYIYISACFGHLVLIDQEGGYPFVWLVFVIAFATDTFAYFIGIKFGRKKLAPLVSPKKTVEGAIGGIIGAIICCFIYALFFEAIDVLKIVPIAIVGSIASQMGDLFASAMKREYEVKDYGKLIPGHGGILDRFDSTLFVTPIVYYGVLILGKF